MKITFCCTPNICWTLCESSSCTKPATYIVSFLSKAIFWLKNTQNLMFFVGKSVICMACTLGPLRNRGTHTTILEHALWMTHAVRMTHAQSGSHISPLSAHPARTSPPFWPRAKPKFWLLGGRELWCGPYQNALLHSLLGAMLDWKFISDNLFDTCLCDRWTQLNSNGW